MIGELPLEVDRPDVTVLPCRGPHWKGRTCGVDGDIGNATRTGRGRGKRIVRFRGDTNEDTRRSRAPTTRTRVLDEVEGSAPSDCSVATRNGRAPRRSRRRKARTRGLDEVDGRTSSDCLVATPGGRSPRRSRRWKARTRGLDEIDRGAPSPALWRHRADMTRAEADLGRLAPRFERARRQRIAHLVATPGGHAPKPIFEGSHSRLRQRSPKHSTVPTAATEGTHRVGGGVDGDIDGDESAPADWPTATSPHRSPGGDTGGTSQRGRSRAGRTRGLFDEVNRSASFADWWRHRTADTRAEGGF